MTSTIAGQNSNAKASKLPIPVPNRNPSAVGEDISASQAKKPPFETRKSAEELKLRLASAVSAKIALNNKDGRNSSSNASNRGIGFLLQRKEQQENRLNTKDISFQKSVRNGGEKPVEMMAKNPVKDAKNGMKKAELQKSLLSALMNSRAPSGAGSGQNRGKDIRVGSASKLNSDTKGKTSASEFGKAPLSTAKATNETAASKSKLDNKVLPGQKKETSLGLGSKMSRPSAVAGKTSKSEFNKAPLSTLSQRSENIPSKSPVGSSNASGGILDRAKHIERLLGQRKLRENMPVESVIAGKDLALNGKDKNAELNEETTNVNGKRNSDFNLGKTATATKPIENGKEGIATRNANLNKMVKTTKLASSPSKDGDTVLNGRTNGVFKLKKGPKTTQPFQNTATEGTASINGEKNGKFGVNESVETRKSSVGKKPPPVAKKPSKENMQRSPQATSPLGIDKQDSTPFANGYTSSDSKLSRQNEPPTITTKGNSPQIQRKAGALKVDGVIPKNGTASLLNATVSGKDAAFREDLLEKLEADVGNCKIAAFQSMEDFSALRMKVYRMRGELDQLKRDRERRTSLVC